MFRTSMGHPIPVPSRIGSFVADDDATVSLPIGNDSVPVTITSMGNPHCSTFWPDVAVAPIDRLGPVIEHHPWFANRTNVEFIQVLDRHRLRVRFWERGVGVTLASGTGSSAAAVAAALNGFVESPITVETELGSLLVEWSPGMELFLTGPAEFICRGEYSVVTDETA